MKKRFLIILPDFNVIFYSQFENYNNNCASRTIFGTNMTSNTHI